MAPSWFDIKAAVGVDKDISLEDAERILSPNTQTPNLPGVPEEYLKKYQETLGVEEAENPGYGRTQDRDQVINHIENIENEQSVKEVRLHLKRRLLRRCFEINITYEDGRDEKTYTVKSRDYLTTDESNAMQEAQTHAENL